MSEQLEKVFVALVERSWKRYNEHLENKYMDDLLVGAVIASTVQLGYALIDLNSDGQRHYLRFEHLPTKERLIFELTNLSEELVTAKVLGRWARTVIGYGKMVKDTQSVWSAFKSEFKSGFMDDREPGIITFDADLTAGYIYTQVPLLLHLDDYFGENFQVNHRLLQQHLGATVHTLKKYLNGRLR
jgi:hypothetical protein